MPPLPADRIFLWIDFLCINQDDIEERNSQVTMMSDIFGYASGVIGWIGDPTPQSDQAFRLLLDHAAIFEVEDPKDSSSADHVTSAVIERMEKNMLCDEENWNDIMPMAFQRMRDPEARDGLLGSLMTIGGNAECTESRDKVYGVLGLMSPQDRECIVVDYRKSVLQVFAEACYNLFSHQSMPFFANLYLLTGSLSTPLAMEEGLNTDARGVELETWFTGTITGCELCAIVEKATAFHSNKLDQ